MPSRLRLIAGPNGSGKTTLTNNIRKKLGEKFGIYLNADEMEKQLRVSSTLSFGDYGLQVSKEYFNSFYTVHPLYERALVVWTNDGISLTFDIGYVPVWFEDYVLNKR